MNLFKPDEHLKDYDKRKPNDENFLFEIEDNEYFSVGEKVINFESFDIIVKYSLDLGSNDNKLP